MKSNIQEYFFYPNQHKLKKLKYSMELKPENKSLSVVIPVYNSKDTIEKISLKNYIS